MGAGFGGVVFLERFVSGNAISGLGFFTDSGGVMAGCATERARFFSSVLISMGSFDSSSAPPLLFKFGAGGIVGMYSVVKSWVIVCCVPASFPEGGGTCVFTLGLGMVFWDC